MNAPISDPTCGLGWALGERRSTNAVVQLQAGRRRLPVGEMAVGFTQPGHDHKFAVTL